MQTPLIKPWPLTGPITLQVMVSTWYNQIILRCKDLDILLGHFHTGSVQVVMGQSLKTGDAIAAVGNSGSTSEPQLHIHAQLPGTDTAPYSGAPIPIRINDQYLVRGDRFVVR